jgi:hypothetical protein
LSAYIHSLKLNLMTIEFSGPLKTEGISLSEFNSSSFYIYLQPYLDWHLRDPNFDKKSLNLTWTAEKFLGTSLIIKLNFSDPLVVSPNAQYDEIIWHVKENATKLF